MNFEATAVEGARIVRVERHEDERGYFARVWCRDEFAAQGIAVDMVQASVSSNRLAGTLRGMHFSWPPAQEGKLVRCIRGCIHDAIVDLRPDSPTYLQQVTVLLDDRSHSALYIPPGVAHGFQTLDDDCEVLYMMTDAYRPELAAGVRHDDPAFGLNWPLPVSCISERDRLYADFDTAAHAVEFESRRSAPRAGQERKAPESTRA